MTLTVQDLPDMIDEVSLNVNVIELQSALASTYTEKKTHIIDVRKLAVCNLLCISLLFPQMTGGDWPPGFDTAKASSKQTVARFDAVPFVPTFVLSAMTLLLTVATVIVSELGPAMLKVSKSNRNCTIDALALQIFTVQ